MNELSGPSGAAHGGLPFAMIDTHAHVFERGLPLARHRRYVPDYDAPLDAYLNQLDRHGVSHGVLVQPSFLGTDCGYLLAAHQPQECLNRGTALAAGPGCIPPDPVPGEPGCGTFCPGL